MFTSPWLWSNRARKVSLGGVYQDFDTYGMSKTGSILPCAFSLRNRPRSFLELSSKSDEKESMPVLKHISRSDASGRTTRTHGLKKKKKKNTDFFIARFGNFCFAVGLQATNESSTHVECQNVMGKSPRPEFYVTSSLRISLDFPPNTSDFLVSGCKFSAGGDFLKRLK